MAWKYFGEWNNIPLFYCLFWYHREVNENLKKYFNTSRKLGFCIIKRKQYLFLDTQWLKDLREQVYLTSAHEIITQLQSFYPEFEMVRDSLFSYYNKSFEELSDKELEESFQKILHLIRSVTPFDQYSMISEQFHLEKFHDELNKLSGVDKTHLSILCSPTKITSTQEEELSLINLALKIQQGKELSKEAIHNHLKKFGWLPVFLFGKPWDEKYVKDEVSRLVKEDDLQSRKERLDNFPDEQRNKISRLQDELSFPKELKDLAKVMQEIAFIRNEAETMISLGTFVLLPIYKEIYRRINLPEEKISTLTPEEIGHILIENKDFSEEINKRLNAAFYVSTPEISIIYDSNPALQMFSENYKKPERETSQEKLEGMCASQGKATGKVCIVRTLEDMNNFNGGDILVSESTCIDFVPVMRRAAAILTEMGGITSHAAIVSRELGVPCIVGINSLLKMLQNGQIVEVNANEWVVKVVGTGLE